MYGLPVKLLPPNPRGSKEWDRRSDRFPKVFTGLHCHDENVKFLLAAGT
jgi:hypothetical protein